MFNDKWSNKKEESDSILA